jgi:hypothetical protein
MTDWFDRTATRHRLIVIYWLLNGALFSALIAFAVLQQ